MPGAVRVAARIEAGPDAAEDLAARVRVIDPADRHATRREPLFSPEIDPARKQTVRPPGEQQCESAHLTLVSND